MYKHTDTLTVCQYVYFDDVHCSAWNSAQQTIWGSSLRFMAISHHFLSLHSLTSYIILTLIADMWPLSRKFWYKFSLTSLECDCSVSIHRPPAVVKEISSIFSTQETCCQWLYSLPGNLRSTEILNSENWMQCNGQKSSHRNVRWLNLTHVANPSLSHK